MKRLWSVLAALLLGLVSLVLVPVQARANGENWRITEYTVEAAVDAHGTTSVHLALSFDFGNDPGHGPYLTFPLRQAIANDPDHWRMLDMTIGPVSSPSGADAAVKTETKDGNLLVRVGSQGRTFTGVQTYEVNYTIRGLIAPQQAQSGLDEFNWNAVGPGWEVPIDSAKVTLTGPAAISRASCFSGGSFDEPCDATASGDGATYSVTQVGNGSGMQVVAGFPAGTFTGAEARLERRYSVGNMFPVTPWTAGIAGVLSALGLAAVLRRTRRSARDQVYLGLTPGVVPATGQEANIGHEAHAAPVAVQFTPPQGARPGELGTLTDATADNRDISATIIDLAVRGHLSIAQTGRRDWTFTRQNGADQLVAYESQLLNRLFSAGGQVTTDDLKDSSYSGLLSGTKGALHRRVATELKWFTANPATVRALALAAGVGLVAVGVGIGFLFGLFGWGLVGAAGVITGLAVMAMNNHFGSRTATGSAVLAQTRGFELYLRTAEADQIRFEEGIDVFSRYLPYAIMFGVAERWTKVFSQLADEGRYTFNTPWYYGYGYGFSYNHFASSLDSLASTMSSSLQSATAATSGGSGFSGGGGFGGGGGGGW
ncbi:MAG: DUF2207 domain-containing protein [Actinobacteria bacterium HGW-Actinobacteria-5]|jgi:uncharacterized membrane protein YgcG|nr:MAG: DUF2207 domain-containing protein [Actinobacteria bacterium HGW-Actinobacteria-5]